MVKEKIINLIIRDENNCIRDIKRIKYQKDKYNDLISINNYLDLEKKEKCEYFNSDFDIECKKLFISNLAQNKGYLDLEIDFTELTFEKFYNVTKSNQLTINCFLECGGIGNIDVFNLFLLLKDIIVCFANVFIFFRNIFVPFLIIRRKYGYGKTFVADIIGQSDYWQFGIFNKLDKIKCRRLVEVAIMEKLGYKFKDKKWIKKTSVYITPDIILRKYDKF